MLSEGRSGKDRVKDIAVPLAKSGCHDSAQTLDHRAPQQNSDRIQL